MCAPPEDDDMDFKNSPTFGFQEVKEETADGNVLLKSGRSVRKNDDLSVIMSHESGEEDESE